MEALVAELLAVAARFGDAVGVEDERVAGLERRGLLPHADLREQPDERTDRADLLDPPVGPSDQRRSVPSPAHDDTEAVRRWNHPRVGDRAEALVEILAVQRVV